MIFYHAFYNAGIRSQLGIMYISYNTFLCLPCRGTTGHLAYLWRLVLLPLLGGWTRQGTFCVFGGLSGSLARGLGTKNTVWLGVRNGSTIDTIVRPPEY
jgi:hypothetical protein